MVWLGWAQILCCACPELFDRLTPGLPKGSATRCGAEPSRSLPVEGPKGSRSSGGEIPHAAILVSYHTHLYDPFSLVRPSAFLSFSLRPSLNSRSFLVNCSALDTKQMYLLLSSRSWLWEIRLPQVHCRQLGKGWPV